MMRSGGVGGLQRTDYHRGLGEMIADGGWHLRSRRRGLDDHTVFNIIYIRCRTCHVTKGTEHWIVPHVSDAG